MGEEEEGWLTPSQPSLKGLCTLVLLREGADGSRSAPGLCSLWGVALWPPVACGCGVWLTGLRTQREEGRK